MTPRVSGSTYERTIHCPASAALPQSPRDEPGEPAERGIAIHEFLENVSLDGRTEALALVPEKYRDACEAIDTDHLPTQLDHEVSFAYDWAAGEARELGRGLNRNYGPLGPTEIALTVDVFGVSQDLRCYVGDYKSGWGDVTAAQENPQIRLGMLAACRHYGRDGGVVEILRVREGSIWRDTAELDVFDLAEEEERCKATMEQVEMWQLAREQGATPDTNPGGHCRYCRSFSACPSQKALALELQDGSMALEVEASWAGGLTPTHAPEAYRKYLQAKALVSRMKDILFAYAKEHPIDLGDGKVFGEKQTRGNEKLDGGTAYAQIIRLYGHAIAEQATKKTTTKAAIRGALRGVADEDSLAERERKALQAIRDAGGSKREPGSTIKEYEEKT